MEIRLKNILDQLSEDKINLVVDDNVLRAAGGENQSSNSCTKSSSSSFPPGRAVGLRESASFGYGPKFKC